MASCDAYEGDQRCFYPAVERLEYLNTLQVGQGFSDVCAAHLEEHIAEEFLLLPSRRRTLYNYE